MRALVIAAAVLFAAPALADHPRLPDNAVAVDQRELKARVAELEELLDLIATESRPRQRARTLKKARQELDALRRMANRAPSVGNSGPIVQPPPPQPPPPPPAPVVYPMDGAAFENLRTAIRRESFPRDQLRVLESAAPANWFVTPQVTQILKIYSFPRDRLQAVRVLKPRILDVENYYTLYAAFEFPSDKAELKKILGQ